MEKKSIFERLGFVESIPEDDGIKEEKLFSPEASSVTQTATSVGETNAPSDIISLAYDSLPQSANNIFVVEDLLKNFGMLEEDKRGEAVRNILKTMGKDVGKFLSEAQTRLNTLQCTLNDYCDGNAQRIKNGEAQIANLKEQIKAYEQEAEKLRQDTEKAKVSCVEEKNRLEKIISVLGGK